MAAIEDNSQRVGSDRNLAQPIRRTGTWGGEHDLYCGGSGKGHAVSAALAGAAQQGAIPSTPDAGMAFECIIKITHDEPDQYSSLLLPSLWAAKNPCRLSGRKKPLPPI